jgi:hypothetical protein
VRFTVSAKQLNYIAASDPETQGAIHRQTNKTLHKAQANLQEARSSTRWYKIIGPDHLTFVDSSFGDIDGFVNLNAESAVGIEFGHVPSGVFGPGGIYEHVKTKSPEGLYIITRAAASS